MRKGRVCWGVKCKKKRNSSETLATCLKSTLLIFLLWPVISPTLVPLPRIMNALLAAKQGWSTCPT